MRSTPHILVINGTKVRRPVFILGAPHSGTDLLARAIKQSGGFHLTAGRPGVLRVTYAFAHRPSIATERERGAARVLRDSYAQAWQMSPRACADCPAECHRLADPPAPAGGPLRLFRKDGREARRGAPPGSPRGAAGDEAWSCVDPQSVHRFADASPDLLYSADVLLDAFPDAQLVQVIRDARDVVADMLEDEHCLTWFKPGIANIDKVFPNPFFGIEDFTERSRWTSAAPAVKCALRWRGAVRLSARLRAQTPAEQLFTVRYEELMARPTAIAAGLSDYLEATVSKPALTATIELRRNRPVPEWSDRLTTRQIVQVEKIAGTELGRLGYRLSGG